MTSAKAFIIVTLHLLIRKILNNDIPQFKEMTCQFALRQTSVRLIQHQGINNKTLHTQVSTRLRTFTHIFHPLHARHPSSHTPKHAPHVMRRWVSGNFRRSFLRQSIPLRILPARFFPRQSFPR